MKQFTTKRKAALAATAAALVTAGVATSLPASASTSTAQHHPKPTVVLVHGAFADASGFGKVIAKLQKDGYPVKVVANPLRGLPTDTAATKDVLRSVKGPVVLVGHSYGGAVITNAGANQKNVKALVYLAALAPDKGETIFGPAVSPIKNPIPAQPLVATKTKAADGTVGMDVIVDPTKFRAVFAADVNRKTAATMAATQRPTSTTVLTDKTKRAAWRTIPSWYLTATKDLSINPELQTFFAKRAKSHVTEVESSHAVYVSHPKATVKIIEKAARSIR